MNTVSSEKPLFWIDQVKFIVVLMAMFYLPTKEEWFRYYTLINCILPLLLIDVRGFRHHSVSLWLIVGWMFFFISSTLLKSFFVPGVDVLREFTELARIFIFIPILLIAPKYLGERGFKILTRFLTVFVLISSYLILAETKFLPKNGFYDFVETNYHYRRQIGLSYLAKGMFSHGALNSLVMNCIVIFIVTLFHRFKHQLLMLVVCFLAIFDMFAGGSRTNMIGLVAFLVVFFGMSLFKGKSKVSPLLLALPAVLFFGASYLISLGLFAKLSILLETGTNTSSVDGRQRNWIAFFNRMDSYWYLGIIGWGKTMFIRRGGNFFTDNDYLTYLIVHGIIPFFTIMFLLAKKVFISFFEWATQNDYDKCFFFLLLFNIVVSTNSAGFSFPLVLIFMTLIFSFSKVAHYEMLQDPT